MSEFNLQWSEYHKNYWRCEVGEIELFVTQPFEDESLGWLVNAYLKDVRLATNTVETLEEGKRQAVEVARTGLQWLVNRFEHDLKSLSSTGVS